MYIKRRIIILTIIFSYIILAVTGCKKNSPEPTDADEAFENTCQYITDTILSGSVLDLHFCLSDTSEYDEEITNKTLGSISVTPSDGENSFYNQALTMVNEIDRSTLSEDKAYQYDLISNFLNNQTALSSHIYKYDPLSAYSGEHVQLPLLLAEFAFNTTNDVEIYFQLLSDFPNYFDNIIQYEKQKNSAGEFMSEDCFNSVINFCKQFPSEDASQHFLAKAFEQKLTSLNIDESLKSSYIQEHLSILKTIVFPAYVDLQNKLTQLSAEATFNNSGLCNINSGREYYQTLVKSKTGDNRALSDIGDELEQNLALLSKTLTTALKGNEQLWETILSGGLDKTLSDEESLAKASEYLDVLYALSKESFNNNKENNFSVEHIEPHLSQYFSSAFFLLPPVDDFDNPTIYINPDTQFTTFDLFTTLAHEGFPGHLQQTIVQKDNLVSRLFSCLGYCEGWATYCELYTYPVAVEYLDLIEDNQTENLAYILKLYRELTLCVYALLDYNIHYNYWTMDDAALLLSDYGITDAATVENIYNYIVNEPANYMTYYVGYINVVNLKEKYIAAGHTENEFHQAFLSCPEAPFEVVENMLLK